MTAKIFQKQREFHEEMAQKEKEMREDFIARVSMKEEEMKRREELVCDLTFVVNIPSQ